MKAEEIHIAVSPMTNTIYAGKVTRNRVEWIDKKEVTEQALATVAEYMDGVYKEIEFPSGTLFWHPKPHQ
ncbi:hypothetical protein JK635_07460 [Neobacillus sp. YIM B02564]|uniref:Uncharacterized protein n=1 Tax=Neobacillus paridis TaxID=2803862 RepID=A0ABS1TP64_9BACI|nr:hypothetical protein [Neobacillus paridis]MBL4952046.1 hypothetical protein [Neobacillus paridis]